MSVEGYPTVDSFPQDVDNAIMYSDEGYKAMQKNLPSWAWALFNLKVILL